MTALLVVALLAQSPPADAPLAVTGETPLLNVRDIEKGEPAPYTGCVMDDLACEVTARGKRACELERAALRDMPPQLPWWAVPLAAVVGLAAGFGLSAVLRQPPPVSPGR